MAAFSDDFNRPDSSDLGPDWAEVSGDWSIISNQLSPGATGGTVILRAAAAMDSDDHYAEAVIAATTSVSHGVWCRGNADITSGYLLRNNGSNWALFSVVGGSFASIGSYAAAAAPGDVAKVEAVGSTIKAFINGIERISVTDTDVPTGTNVGIRSETNTLILFDDFAAADVTTGGVLGTAAATETAQPLPGAKTAALSTAAATSTAQPVAGAKAAALTGAVTSESAQAMAGAKAALLPAAIQDETAQPLAGVVSRSLTLAAAVDTALPLTGTKNATLAPAVETSTARPLAAAGADDDVAVTVSAPYGATYTATAPHAGGWEVGAPW